MAGRKRYMWMLLCNTGVNTVREVACNVCTGCCVGWETRGQQRNGGGALRNAAMRETQFRCRALGYYPPSVSLLTPHTHEHRHARSHRVIHSRHQNQHSHQDVTERLHILGFFNCVSKWSWNKLSNVNINMTKARTKPKTSPANPWLNRV